MEFFAGVDPSTLSDGGSTAEELPMKPDQVDSCTRVALIILSFINLSLFFDVREGLKLQSSLLCMGRKFW
jgi:hypothetical protein